MPVKTPKPFDPADFIHSDEDAAYALQAAFLEDPGDGTVICSTLSNIARARGIAALEAKLGPECTDVYRMLSEPENLSVRTFFRLCAAFHLTFHPTIGKSAS